ncbi:MAG: sigma-70 family RNA polymerase sigma factor [Candidatus Gracilibacteria bacterium]|jgi:RNA polymerase sigma-70 factor (ECF subfamily)|nr:sigma-70 family RNA polymerase sigma factor [Candidatus Gracilibacteria bacterium]
MTDLNENSALIEELVVLVQKGDKDAFSKIYDFFADAVYRYVFFRVNKEDADDLIEQVFLRVWENIGKYKKTKDSKFSSWVFRIAHNLVIDYYRNNKIKDVSELDLDIPTMDREHNPLRKTEDKLNILLLRKALNNIKKHYREFLILKFINELSNKEISDLLDKSEGGIRILQLRALKALKSELVKLGVDKVNF